MSQAITLNGVSYLIPEVGEGGWGEAVTAYLVALSTGVLAESGGSFTLTAEANFGTDFGLKALYYKSTGSSVGSTGILRLANTEAIVWRNAADDGDVSVAVDGSDELTLDGVKVPTISSTDTLTNKTLTTPTLTSPVINTGVSGTAILDEDNMSSDSNTQLATQQSIKAYADTKVDVSQNPVFTSTGSLGLPAGTTAQRTGSPADGMVRYNSTLSRYEGYKDSAWSEIGGGGSGEINYIENPDAEVDTTGWATYDDGASATPIDGTGGTSSNLTLTRQATTVLRGTNSFQLAKGAADAQGEGLSYDFTIDSADRNKLLKIGFDYNTDGTYADEDVKVYIYDVTNTTLITPSDNGIIGVDKDDDSSGSRTIAWGSTDSTSYRLIFHVTTTSASSYDLYLDNVVVGPGSVATGAVITEWEAFTPTGDHTTNVTYTGWKRRVGDTLHVRVHAAYSGATDVANANIDIPDSLTIDTDKLRSIGNQGVIGAAQLFDSGTAYNVTAQISYSTTTRVAILCKNTSETVDNVSATFPFTFASGDFISSEFSVPILEWSGSGTVNLMSDNVVMANARVKYFLGDSSYSSGNTIDYDVLSSDFTTVGTWSNTNGAVTIPSDGTYFIDAGIGGNTGQFFGSTDTFQVKVGGTVKAQLYRVPDSATQREICGTAILQLDAGDVVTIIANTSSTGLSANNNNSYLSIFRLQDYSAGQPVGFGEATSTQSGLLPPPTSMSDELATVLGYKVYAHGTTYNGGNAPTVAYSAGGGSVSSVDTGDFIPYQTQGGAWRLKIDIAVTVSSTSRTFFEITVNGVTFNETREVSTSGNSGAVALHNNFVIDASNRIQTNHSSASFTLYRFAADVELSSKPTWAY